MFDKNIVLSISKIVFLPLIISWNTCLLFSKFFEYLNTKKINKFTASSFIVKPSLDFNNVSDTAEINESIILDGQTKSSLDSAFIVAISLDARSK